MSVLDASALLTFLQGETGADRVEQLLTGAAYCSSVNWSEVAQKIQAAGGDWPLAAALLMSYGLRVEPATLDDGERAAVLWTRGSGLSLADRFCLALGHRLAATIWTADAAWGHSDTIRQVR
ncbi:type II toxin-antitoxin system VapC family toxin [Georgenia sp. MJ170]